MTLLEAVTEARELRDAARREWERAILRASSKHSLRQIAPAAGLTFAGVRYVIQRVKNTPREDEK